MPQNQRIIDAICQSTIIVLALAGLVFVFGCAAYASPDIATQTIAALAATCFTIAALVIPVALVRDELKY